MNSLFKSILCCFASLATCVAFSQPMSKAAFLNMHRNIHAEVFTLEWFEMLNVGAVSPKLIDAVPSSLFMPVEYTDDMSIHINPNEDTIRNLQEKRREILSLINERINSGIVYRKKRIDKDDLNADGIISEDEIAYRAEMDRNSLLEKVAEEYTKRYKSTLTESEYNTLDKNKNGRIDIEEIPRHFTECF